MLALLSPLRVSAPSVPPRFSKLVAPAVVRVNSPVLEPPSAKERVSEPVPPSSLDMLAAEIVGVPLEPVSMRDTSSSPAPISTESPFFNLAEVKKSSPPPISKVQLPV